MYIHNKTVISDRAIIMALNSIIILLFACLKRLPASVKLRIKRTIKPSPTGRQYP